MEDEDGALKVITVYTGGGGRATTSCRSPESVGVDFHRPWNFVLMGPIKDV